MSEILNPRVDLVFKRIFGVEENKDLTISLINSIVSEADQIMDLTFLNPYNFQNFANDKLSILDIKAEGKDGKKYNIEIQVSDEGDYDKRALYYWAKLYTDQLAKGEEYGTLSKAIGIHILNFNSIPKNKKYHNVFHLTEKETGLHYFEDMELHTIELSKFEESLPKQELNNFVSKIRKSLDLWSSFLTRHELLDSNALTTKMMRIELKKALGVLRQMNFTQNERYAYEDRLKWMQIEANTLKNQFNKGMAQGIAQGIKKGELHKAKSIAANLLSKGLSIEKISECTGLVAAEIKEL